MTPPDGGERDRAVARRLVYRLDGPETRRAVLEDFFTAAMSGVRALGVDGDDGPRLVVRCRTEGDAVLVDHVVRQLAPTAVALSGQAVLQELHAPARGARRAAPSPEEELTP